jgi:glycosyltransferase involved in cell wall biosynthesis
MKISICIPTWEQHGYGKTFLTRLLETINSQSYKNFNVVVSDHSVNSEIYETCISFNKKFEIIYVKNESNRGNGPANTNNCIKSANGDLIKIMFQDDFFFDTNSLKYIVESFENNKGNWLVNGCNHTYDDGKTYGRTMIPKWNDEILFGKNTISSPSVLSFKNFDSCFFDENLTMLMDCEMYYQLYIRYGLPIILDKTLVTNRIHKYQISSTYTKNISDEISYIKIKYNLQ